MKLRNALWYTGGWLYLTCVGTIYAVTTYARVLQIPVPDIHPALIWGLPLIIPAKIIATNRKRAKRGETDFGFRDALGLNVHDDQYSKERLAATYPPVNPKYLSTYPQDLVLGKQGNKYVSVPIGSDGINIFAVGTPGAGKTVVLLSILLANLYGDKYLSKSIFQSKAKKKPFNFFVVDVKPEIFWKLMYLKGGVYNAEDDYPIQVVQPSNRRSYGWDVFYRIHKDGQKVSETEKLKMVTDIADALVCKGGDNPFFPETAKKILTGLLFFFVGKGWEFIPIIQKVLRTTFNDLLTEVVEEAEKERNGIVLDKLKSYVGKNDNEALQDVEATMKTYLDVFSYPDIIYCLKDNPHRTSPAALNDGVTNIDLAIEESMLLTYQPVFRLITMQVLRHAESDFKETDDRRTFYVLDEFARIGEVAGLEHTLSTARSRHTTCFMLFQDVLQLRDIYPREKAGVILNLCEVKLFLSGSGDKETTDYVAGMVGEYTTESASYGRGGLLGGPKDTKYSQTRRQIVDGKAMMDLRKKGEMIAIIYGEYYRFIKLRYFEDRYLASIAREIYDNNTQIMKEEE